jgi:hypothetical protein
MATPRPIKEVPQTPQLDKLVGKWWNAHKALGEAAEIETEARMALYAYFYKETDPKRSEAGTERFGMPGGWVLDIERRINVKIDQAALDPIKKVISELPPDPDTGEMATIDAAIKYKPDFSESGYRNLRADVKVILSEALTFTPGKPGFKLEYKEKAKAKPKDGIG